MNAPVLHAAVDLGTNSFHLVVARVDPDGRFDIVAQEKEMVRLGHGSGDMRRLTDDAIERGIACLHRFRQIAESFGAGVRAVATSAVREAENRDDFVRRARAEAGVDVEVVTGVEEARLIHLGVLQGLPVFDQQLLLIDIGGGSTEVLVGKGPSILGARSLKLGAIRLTDRFFPDGLISPGAVDACRLHVKAFIQPALRDLEGFGHDVAVGCSGTITTLVRMALAARGVEADTVAGARVPRAALTEVVRAVTGAPTVDDRRRLAGIDERRADILVGGAVLLEQLLEGLGVGALTVSPYALREGILLDTARAAAESDELGALDDIRRASVMAVARRFDEDLPHVHRITDLAVTLFDHLMLLHGLRRWHRDLLEAGALLHNVGLYVSHAAHHKHSYYVIRNSDQLAGFTDHEIELVAQIARYHRKSAPKPSHPDYAALDADDQRIVGVLAGILRVAIALDRTRRQAVDEIVVRLEGSAVALDIVPRRGADISLELYTAEDRLGLLAASLERDVRIRAVEPLS